jgi:hypothetical protein
MHAIAVEFDFVQPVVAVRRRLDQLAELRPDPFAAERPRRCAVALTAAPCRPGLRNRRMRLLEMVDLADMLGGMGELKSGCPCNAGRSETGGPLSLG